MRNFTLLTTLLLTLSLTLTAQNNSAQKQDDPKFKFNPYGFVRTDFYYNSRGCVAGVNDVFNLYPMNISPDANGEDLNAYPNSGFFAFVTRLGLDVAGPKVLKATSSAKIEVDFGGYGNMNTLLRIRQAYINLGWESGSTLLMGQSWHPLFGEVSPNMVNLSTGAPFQPFNRAPQIRYSYKTESGVKFTTAALWQLQYTSNGPEGKSNSYQANSCIPELYVGVDYLSKDWLLGAGVDILNIQPRTQYTGSDGNIYKVDELMSAFSGEVHLKYSGKKWRFAAKSLIASSLDHTTMLGGYGVSEINQKTGKQCYTPLYNSTTWANITYGNKWSPSLFVGYTKNFGASKEIVGDIYGNGINIDQLLGCNISMSYKLASWHIALEYSATSAWYGDVNSYGAVDNSHSVINHRVASIVMFMF